jgi:flagellar capping protein FliD
MNDFRKKNMDIIGEKSITNPATWNTFKTTVTDKNGVGIASGISVSSRNDAVQGSFSFQVQQRAQGDMVRGDRTFDTLNNSLLGSRTMGQEFSFTGSQFVEINGVSIVANASDTINAFITRVNASNAGVNMRFNSVRGTFELEQKRTGENATISTGGGRILQRMGLDNIRTGLEPPVRVTNGMIAGNSVLTESRFLNANIWAVSDGMPSAANQYVLNASITSALSGTLDANPMDTSVFRAVFGDDTDNHPTTDIVLRVGNATSDTITISSTTTLSQLESQAADYGLRVEVDTDGNITFGNLNVGAASNAFGARMPTITAVSGTTQAASNAFINQLGLTSAAISNVNTRATMGGSVTIDTGNTSVGNNGLLEIHITANATTQAFVNQINLELEKHFSHVEARFHFAYQNGVGRFFFTGSEVDNFETGNDALWRYTGLQNISRTDPYVPPAGTTLASGGLASARNNPNAGTPITNPVTNAVLNSRMSAFSNTSIIGNNMRIGGVNGETTVLTITNSTTFQQLMDSVNARTGEPHQSDGTGVGMFFNHHTGSFSLATSQTSVNQQGNVIVNNNARITTNDHALLQFLGLNDISWSNAPLPPTAEKVFNEHGMISGIPALTEARFMSANLWDVMGVPRPDPLVNDGKVTLNAFSANGVDYEVELAANTSVRGFMTAMNVELEKINAVLSFDLATGSFRVEGAGAGNITTGPDSVLEFFGLANIEGGADPAFLRNMFSEAAFRNMNIWQVAGLSQQDSSFTITVDGSVNVITVAVSEHTTVNGFINSVNNAIWAHPGNVDARIFFDPLTSSFKFRGADADNIRTGDIDLLNEIGLGNMTGGTEVASNRSLPLIEPPFVIATNAMMNAKISPFGDFEGPIEIERDGVSIAIIDIDGNTTFQDFFNAVNAKSAETGLAIVRNTFNGAFSLGVVDPAINPDTDNGKDEMAKIKTLGENFMEFLGLNNINNPDSTAVKQPERHIDKRVVNVAQNAIILYDPNSSDAKLIEQATNTFDLHGHLVTLGTSLNIPADGSGVDITINAERDTSIALEAIENFIEEYNNLIRYVNSLHSTARPRAGNRVNGAFFEPLTDEERKAMSERDIEIWEEQARTGLLHRDSDMRNLHNLLRNAMFQRVNLGDGKSISMHDLGITTVGRNGAPGDQLIGILQISDRDRLIKMLEDNPDEVEAFFTRAGTGDDVLRSTIEQRNKRAPNVGVGFRIDDILRTFADDDRGPLRQRAGYHRGFLVSENAMSRQIQDYNARITRMEQWLHRRENHYYSMFARMEQAMGESQSQMDSLFAFMMQ